MSHTAHAGPVITQPLRLHARDAADHVTLGICDLVDIRDTGVDLSSC
jgi:hypothetical protein